MFLHLINRFMAPVLLIVFTITSGASPLTVGGAATQMDKLRSRIFSLPGDYSILPGHGPPSSLEAERRFNMGAGRFVQRRNRKPAFRLGL